MQKPTRIKFGYLVAAAIVFAGCGQSDEERSRNVKKERIAKVMCQRLRECDPAGYQNLYPGMEPDCVAKHMPRLGNLYGCGERGRTRAECGLDTPEKAIDRLETCLEDLAASTCRDPAALSNQRSCEFAIP